MSIAANAILRPAQRRLLVEFAKSPLSGSFYLSGGTALAAFHLGHRRSDDLDFFTEDAVPIEVLLSFLRGLDMGVPEFQHLFDRRIFALPDPAGVALKVEFTRYPFPRCERGLVVDGVEIDSLRDILVNKLLALTERNEPKDVVDLYCGLHVPDPPAIDRLVDDAERKFGVHGIGHILRAKFLAVAPSIDVLDMRTTLDAGTVAAFFHAIARRWVRESLSSDDA